MLSSEPRLPQRAPQGAQKLLEERPGVVRTRCSLWVVLDPEDWKVAVAKTLDRPVVEIHVRHFQLPGALHRPLIALYRETMVLRGNEHPAGFDFLDRMISPAMAVGHLCGRSAKSESQELMPKANSECRD